MNNNMIEKGEGIKFFQLHFHHSEETNPATWGLRAPGPPAQLHPSS